MPQTFADKIIAFNKQLRYTGKLPPGFQVLNPFLENPETLQVMRQFYNKYYKDTAKLKFIIGINPSRHGAGVTGVPFTDTKRLDAVCGIKMKTAYTHEVSSVFVYDLIAAYGGADKFYKEFYINSPFPLAIIRKTKNGNWLNANYYDEQSLFESVKKFMIQSLQHHISLGLYTDVVYVWGKKNAGFIRQLNKEAGMFTEIITLEHPRYIQQYKFKERDQYIDQFIVTFRGGNSSI